LIPCYDNVMSSIKPEVHNTPSEEDWATATGNIHKRFGEVCRRGFWVNIAWLQNHIHSIRPCLFVKVSSSSAPIKVEKPMKSLQKPLKPSRKPRYVFELDQYRFMLNQHTKWDVISFFAPGAVRSIVLIVFVRLFVCLPLNPTKFCTVVHTSKDHQICFVGGLETRQTNPKWRSQ